LRETRPDSWARWRREALTRAVAWQFFLDDGVLRWTLVGILESCSSGKARRR
jgi:hypothetical protein